jgi:hypothetical protein
VHTEKRSCEEATTEWSIPSQGEGLEETNSVGLVISRSIWK